VQARQERNWVRALVAWIVFIALVLTAYTAVSFVQDRHRLAHAPDALRVRITANQWWWQVDYLDPDPSRQVGTANELHLPLGRMTRIDLLSGDVIHSLWIPALNGKEDLIPGRSTQLALTPRVSRPRLAFVCIVLARAPTPQRPPERHEHGDVDHDAGPKQSVPHRGDRLRLVGRWRQHLLAHWLLSVVFGSSFGSRDVGGATAMPWRPPPSTYFGALPDSVRT
jgi:hypothetical protein